MTDGNQFRLTYREDVPVLESLGDPEAKPSLDDVEQWQGALDASLDKTIVGRHDYSDVRVWSSLDEVAAERLALCAARCCNRLERMLGPRAFDRTPHGALILHLAEPENYYAYLDAFYSEGEHGGSAGCQIRRGYPHVVLQGKVWHCLEAVLAHEMLHLAVCGHPLPIWLEEGMAQMFEIDMGAYDWLAHRRDDTEECRDFWNEQGDLDAFWFGDGFHDPTEMQKHSYLMAEILTRNVVTQYARRGWFTRNKPSRLEQFVWSALYEDAGQKASEQYLGRRIETIATDFLGN